MLEFSFLVFYEILEEVYLFLVVLDESHDEGFYLKMGN